jgi:hypothetical protein
VSEGIVCDLRRMRLDSDAKFDRNNLRYMVELLYWEGCPSHDRALEELRELLDELGHADLSVDKLRIDTEEEAAEQAFVGSPTIRVNGMDPFPAEPEGARLSCRVYRLADGRFSPTPDRDELREALRRLLSSAT